MLAIFNIMAPIFILIGMGYGAIRFGMFEFSQLRGLGKFVLKIGLPALVFYAIASKPITQVFQPIYLAGYALGSIAVFGLGWWFNYKIMGSNKLWCAISSFGMSMSNSGFIGYSLLAMVIGSEAGVYLAMNILVENLFIVPLVYILADFEKSSGSGSLVPTLLAIAKNLLKNPIIIAMLAGLFFGLSGVTVPTALEKVSAMLAAAAAPVALFVIGSGLYGLKIQGNKRDVALITFGKLVMHPVLVVGLLWIFGADKGALFAGALLSSVPMASIFPVIGQQYGFTERPAAAMLVTTVLSFITIFTVLFLGRLNGS